MYGGGETCFPGDRLIEPTTATAKEIKDQSKERHIGSPTSIIFLSDHQRLLWGDARIILLADYSTGVSSLTT